MKKVIEIDIKIQGYVDISEDRMNILKRILNSALRSFANEQDENGNCYDHEVLDFNIEKSS